MKEFINTHTGLPPVVEADQQIDHPERMLFFAFVGAILCWAAIGLMGWGIWALLQLMH